MYLAHIWPQTFLAKLHFLWTTLQFRISGKQDGLLIQTSALSVQLLFCFTMLYFYYNFFLLQDSDSWMEILKIRMLLWVCKIQHNSGENAHYLFSFYVNLRRDTRIFHVINMINNLYSSPHQKESCELRRQRRNKKTKNFMLRGHTKWI